MDAAEQPQVKEEKQEQAVFQDEENAAAADPQSPPEEVKPQVYWAGRVFEYKFYVLHETY